MIAKISFSFIVLITFSLVLATLPSGSAISYTGHDGSVDEYITKKKVEPYKGRPGYWVYFVEVCAENLPMKPAAVILKSDMSSLKMTGITLMKPYTCQTFGSVMKAKNPDSLGAELIEQHEAIQHMKMLIAEKKGMSKSDHKQAMHEIMQYYQMVGFIPK